MCMKIETEELSLSEIIKSAFATPKSMVDGRPGAPGVLAVHVRQLVVGVPKGSRRKEVVQTPALSTEGPTVVEPAVERKSGAVKRPGNARVCQYH